MDIQKELTEAKRKREEIVEEINQKEQERQMLLQEALRLDGEVRALERMAKENKAK